MSYYATVPHALNDLPLGNEIRATLKSMAKLAKDGGKDVGVITLARQCLRQNSVAARDAPGEIRCLQGWVRDHIRYTRDPRDAEMVQTPQRTLQIGTGDCDDQATLLAALLLSIGYTPSFMALALNGQDFSHVLSQVRMGSQWVPLETILPGVQPGWLPPHITGRMIQYL